MYHPPAFVQGQAIFEQHGRIDVHLVLANFAAETEHIRDSGDGAQLELYEPVIKGPQFHGRFVLADQDVFIDLSQARGDGTHFGFSKPFGDAFLRRLHPFQHQLPREISIDIILEDDGHYRKSCLGHGTDIGHIRQAVHYRFNREGDEFLNFHGGQPGGCRIYLHLDIGDVRESIHIQLERRIHPVAHQPEAEYNDEKPVA